MKLAKFAGRLSQEAKLAFLQDLVASGDTLIHLI